MKRGVEFAVYALGLCRLISPSLTWFAGLALVARSAIKDSAAVVEIVGLYVSAAKPPCDASALDVSGGMAQFFVLL